MLSKIYLLIYSLARSAANLQQSCVTNEHDTPQTLRYLLIEIAE